MFARCNRAVSRISARKPRGAEAGDQLGVEHLQRDRPVVLEVLGEAHDGHPARAHFALETVAPPQGRP